MLHACVGLDTTGAAVQGNFGSHHFLFRRIVRPEVSSKPNQGLLKAPVADQTLEKLLRTGWGRVAYLLSRITEHSKQATKNSVHEVTQ